MKYRIYIDEGGNPDMKAQTKRYLGENSFEATNKKGPYGPNGFAIHLRIIGLDSF